MKKETKMNNKGFSLVELIVVIAIMAILVGALAPQLLKYIERSRQAADIQAAGALFTAIQTANADPMIDESTKTASNALTASNDFGDAILDTIGGTAPVFKSKAYSGQTASVSITANSITVTVGTNDSSVGKAFHIDENGQAYD